MTNDEKPVTKPFVMLREEFDDWAVLFDPDTAHGFGLNPAGVYVWKLLDGQHAIDALLQKINLHADDVPEDVGDHIRAFVDDLVAHGLVGLDSADCGLGSSQEKLHSSPPGALSEVTRFRYEPPQLVYLNSEQEAHGVSPCTFGSQAKGGKCQVGNHACAACSGGTLASGSGCCTGTCIGSDPACGCGNSYCANPCGCPPPACPGDCECSGCGYGCCP
jgi:SynChlorMet cassette protein ScmD